MTPCARFGFGGPGSNLQMRPRTPVARLEDQNGAHSTGVTERTDLRALFRTENESETGPPGCFPLFQSCGVSVNVTVFACIESDCWPPIMALHLRKC